MFKLFKNLDIKSWILILVCIVLILIQVWLELKMPDYMSKITVLVQTEGSQMSEILNNGGKMLLCAVRKLDICYSCGIHYFKCCSKLFYES